MSVAQIVQSGPHPHAFTFIRRQLLRTRQILMTQLASKTTSQAVQETLADSLDQASSERLSALDELIQERTYAKLLQVEQALDHMRDASYGMCHGCRTNIPLPRLRVQPAATLCVACQERCEQRTVLRGGL